MPDSISEQLQRDMVCEALLECIYGLKRLDEQCFRALAGAEDPLTVDEISEIVDRERSTAYRSIQRLLQAGFVRKEQVNYEQGGYYHVYSPTDTEQISDGMQQMLDDWHEKMDRLVREFEEQYGRQDAEIAAEG